jgi:hypothetical protein
MMRKKGDTTTLHIHGATTCFAALLTKLGAFFTIGTNDIQPLLTIWERGHGAYSDGLGTCFFFLLFLLLFALVSTKALFESTF